MKKPLVILELANNHMGDLKHAEKILNKYNKLTKEFKKNLDFAIKFQHRDLKTYLHANIASDDERVTRFTSTELSEKNWNKLINSAKKNFKVICTPFSEVSVDWICKKKFDYLKIASCSFNDWPLLKKIKKKKIKIICSLGGGSLNEITKTVSFLSTKNIKYLYCVGMYPTFSRDMNLSYFSKLREVFGDCISGFSSHEEPQENLSGALAYGMGARIFEKHINIKSKKYKLNKYSVTPEQFYKWLYNLNHAIILSGNPIQRDKNLNREKKDINKFKRGVFVKKNFHIKKDDQLDYSNIEFKFPAEKGQLLANEFSRFNFIKSKKNLSANVPVLKKFIKINNTRKTIEKIREKVKIMIRKSKLIIPKNMKLEISYHYGLDNFYKTGLCMITQFNSGYCKKFLFLFPKQIHPTQFHKIKKESFFILMGKIQLIIDKRKYILKKGDMITIQPKQKHFFKDISSSGSIIEEISSESIKSDSYYVDQKITKNKNRKSFISLNN